MFPGLQTECQLREMDRRFLLDRLSRERALDAASAVPTSRSKRTDRVRNLVLSWIAPSALGRSLSRPIGSVGTGQP